MKLFFIFIFSLYATINYCQNDLHINDGNYKFEITFPSGWKNSRTEETDKKDVINYTFEKKNNQIAVSILAFKIDKFKSIDDIIYTLEKDFSLGIPEKISDYTDISGEKYIGKTAEYKDNESKEKIYYFTTKIESNGFYYSYMIRFICDAKANIDSLNQEILAIYNTFKINI